MAKKYFIAGILFFSFALCFARENITDWYLKDFQSYIVVNPDSSLSIEERIVADCGNLPNKHGIFRILPETVNYEEGKIKTPVKLLAIENFQGQKHKFAQTKSDSTVTWKIGDPYKTVSGENEYLIRYRVENAVRTENAEFDELYWNLNGNFWEIETDRYVARIKLPAGADENNSEVWLYSGSFGAKDSKLADYRFIDSDILEITSLDTLKAREGITVSITFPKGLVNPYVPPFWDRYGQIIMTLIAIAGGIGILFLWKKFGKDPSVNKTVMAEYEPPNDLSCVEVGMIKSQGAFKNSFIPAAIVDLAVKGFLTIGKKDKEGFFGSQDLVFKNLNKPHENILSPAEELILSAIFKGGEQETQLSKLKKTFYKDLPEISNAARKNIEEKGLIPKHNLLFKGGFIALGIAILISGILLASMALAILGAFTVIIAFFMPRRTVPGAEANWKIQGFKLFMETAEKYRQQFYEKEGIFEKYLPYAMVFGITKLWINKIKEIYGEDYFKDHHPAWYIGGDMASFDANTFSSQMTNLASAISSSVSGPTGSGGSGSSGGGGGGGGGGGW